MSNCDLELVTNFEVNGMTPEQIAQDAGLEVSAVKAFLMQYSALYRQLQQGGDKSLELTNDEFDEVKQTLFEIMRYQKEDRPNTSAKIAMFLYKDKKGYLNPQAPLPSINLNVMDFNGRMKQCLAAEERTAQKAIEIAERKGGVCAETNAQGA